MAKRDGPDQKFDTRDDKLLADLAAADAVAYVAHARSRRWSGCSAASAARPRFRTGYQQLRNANSGSGYTGSAVDGATAYLAGNDRSIYVVNLKIVQQNQIIYAHRR